jgi:hypothetical protein
LQEGLSLIHPNDTPHLLAAIKIVVLLLDDIKECNFSIKITSDNYMAAKIMQVPLSISAA